MLEGHLPLLRHHAWLPHSPGARLGECLVALLNARGFLFDLRGLLAPQRGGLLTVPLGGGACVSRLRRALLQATAVHALFRVLSWLAQKSMLLLLLLPGPRLLHAVAIVLRIAVAIWQGGTVLPVMIQHLVPRAHTLPLA